MIFHRIIFNSDPSTLDRELKVLLEKSYPEASHKDRIQGFYSSRNSLLENLKHFYPDCDYQGLFLDGFHKLHNYKDITLSISHSSIAGASVVALKNDYKSLGIDIEPLSRQVKDSIIQRVTTHKDLKLTNLEIWCLKEAIYKCVSNSEIHNGVLEFRDMEIKSQYWVHSPSGLSGEWKISIELDHQIAIATLKNQNS